MVNISVYEMTRKRRQNREILNLWPQIFMHFAGKLAGGLVLKR